MHSFFFITAAAILVQITNLIGYTSTVDAAPIVVTLPDYGILNFPNGNKYLFTKLNDAPNFGFSQWGTIVGDNKPQESPVPIIQVPASYSTQANFVSIISDNKQQTSSAPVVQPPAGSSNQPNLVLPSPANNQQASSTPVVQVPVGSSTQASFASIPSDNKPQASSTPAGQAPAGSANQAIIASVPSDNTVNNASQTNFNFTLVDLTKVALNTTRGAIRNNADKLGNAAGTAVGTTVTAVTAPVLGPGSAFAGATAGKITSNKVETVLIKCTEETADATCLIK
ncbi:hypothetical protein BDF19DRAFT_416957 [Syncephalis fuscata]|nr:hypothetical protein BDF19DRAFT_416957 [Syncephalis fuscata]